MEELRTNDYLKGIVSNLPESPGIYQYLNTEGTIIYVGKAKNLKRRVSSYFKLNPILLIVLSAAAGIAIYLGLPSV